MADKKKTKVEKKTWLRLGAYLKKYTALILLTILLAAAVVVAAVVLTPIPNSIFMGIVMPIRKIVCAVKIIRIVKDANPLAAVTLGRVPASARAAAP